jgi:hypothetical protein
MPKKQGPDGSMFDTETGKVDGSIYGEAGTVEPDDPFDWGNVDSVLLSRVASLVTNRRHGFSLATNYNRDGGSLTILAGDLKPKWKFDNVQEAEERLRILLR